MSDELFLGKYEILKEWDDLVGRTVECVDDGDDELVVRFKDQSILFIYGSSDCVSIDDEPIFSTDALVHLNLITDEEADVIRAKDERDRQRRLEAVEREEFERLKRKYGTDH
jgi:hypothetical protein